MRKVPAAVVASTPRNSIGASVSFTDISGHADGKKTISPGSCVRLTSTQRLDSVAVAGPGSDSEGVVATFFLIRYQRAVASRTDINFACQFFRSSLFIRTVQ